MTATLEQLLEKVPEGWLLASVIVRRDKGWCYGSQFTYDALFEDGDNEITGEGPTPTAAITAALRKIER